jgi:RNA-directed DNA polymerase
MRAERRDPTLLPKISANPRGEEPVSEAKPYDISKQLVWEAYQRVKANRGAAGVDGVSLAAFEKDLKGNLYKVWNRMSSGSYHPPPVRLVEIPKDNGGTRPLGIPTIADRVAQTVVKMVLEPLVEPRSPSGLLRLSTRSFCARRSRDGTETLLGDRLGHRFGHQGVL